MYGTKTLLVVAAIGGFGLLLVAAALAGQFPWVRLVALLAGLTLMWSSLACGPMIYKRMAGSQVKYPRWLPPGFRPVPSRLSEARLYASTVFGQKWRAATQVAGWLHQDQAAMLCHLAKLAPEGPIVEIGSFRGKSTVFLASGMKDSNRVFAIDPHILSTDGRPNLQHAAGNGWNSNANGVNTWEAFNKTLRDWGIADRVKPIKDFSYAVRPQWNEPIAMLWIDGDHAYGSIKRDIEDWVDMVKPGGFLAFHDTAPDHAGKGDVRRAIMETGVLTRRGFSSFVELRNAWFLQRKA